MLPIFGIGGVNWSSEKCDGGILMFQGQIGEILLLSAGKLGLFLILAIFIHPSLPKMGTPTQLKPLFPEKVLKRAILSKSFIMINWKLKAVFNYIFFWKKSWFPWWQNERYLINFTFHETFKDEPIPHKNFSILGQGSHEIPGGVTWPLLWNPMWVPKPLVTEGLSICFQQLHRAMHFLSDRLELILTSRDWLVFVYQIFHPINISITWRHKFYWFWKPSLPSFAVKLYAFEMLHFWN